MSQSPQSQDRQIRVFVSSTFRDMQAERDELVLRVFPQLRRLCEQRGVTWGEVDLRWGITEEQAQRGEVLPICLEEIRRCRPYFIGLLSERYGWIPDTIPEEVVEREPWVGELAAGATRKSLTELEILHGVLNDPAMADHAFFYFRDPEFVDSVPDDRRTNFTSEDSESRTKLGQLKDRIRQAHHAEKLKIEPRENYPDAKALGARVLEDFTALIDTLYPEGEQPSPLERERMDHEAFARSRASVYIGRQEYFDWLDAHAAASGPPLLVLGESGSGKSALLSNWALLYRERHPEDFLLPHFIGASPDSANATALLRRIMLELKQRFDLPDDVPSQPEKIREAFPDWLTQTAGGGRIVLVLDGMNQLEDVDNAPDLGWLPRVFPHHCRVILSTLPGRGLDAVTDRGWLERTPPLEVQPLDEAERVRLAWKVLRKHRKRLSKPVRRKVALAEQSRNPLYLRVLLDELRVFGVHEKLGERIDWYLGARNPQELYRKVIARWEEAYADGSELVRETLSLLWVARRGLSETELLEALGQPGRPLPRARWSPLFLAMSDALVSRSGLLTFAHDFLRTAAREGCLPDESDQQNAHRRLARYFQRQGTWNDRRLDELPWQLASAYEWPQLHDALTEEACFLGLQERNKYELLGYWLKLKGEFDLANSYTAAFARWEQNGGEDSHMSYVANQLALFLQAASCFSAAEPLFRRALAIDEQCYGVDHREVAAHLNNLAELFRVTNRPTEAEPLFRRALDIWETSLGDEHSFVAYTLNNLGLLLHAKNRMEEAEPLLRRALAIDERLLGPEHPNVARGLNNIGHLLKDTNRLADAEQLFRRALAIDEQSCGADHPTVARRLNNLAQVLHATHRLEEAETLMQRVVDVFEVAYGKEHPHVATALNNLAGLLQTSDRLAEAEPLYRRALAIDELSYEAAHPDVARDLNNLAQLLHLTNRLEEAEPLMRRALAIDEHSYGLEHPSVARDLHNLAMLLQDTRRLAEAEPLMRRALAISEQSLGADHPDVASALNMLAQLFYAMNRVTEAEPLYRRALGIDEQTHGDHHPDVARDLNNLAQLLQDTNRLDEAETLMRRVVDIFEVTYGKENRSFATALNNLALLLQAMSRLVEAESLHRRALVIDEQSNRPDDPAVARDVNNLARALHDMNRLEEAEPLYRRALAIWVKSLGDEHPNVASALFNLAELLHDSKRLAEAEPLYRRALAVWVKSLGDEHPNVAKALINLALLLKATNRLTEAEPLMRRRLEILLNLTVATRDLHPHIPEGLAHFEGLLQAMGRSDAEVRRELTQLLAKYGLSLG